MSTVTLDRQLAESLLVLMHRVYGGEVVHPTQWRLFMSDLERALEAPPPTLATWMNGPEGRTLARRMGEALNASPRTHENAPGSTQEPEARQPLTLAGAIALVAGEREAHDWAAYFSPAAVTCAACHERPRLVDRDFCGPCQDELDADLAELHDHRQSGHPGSRCNAACGHCGMCG